MCFRCSFLLVKLGDSPHFFEKSLASTNLNWRFFSSTAPPLNKKHPDGWLFKGSEKRAMTRFIKNHHLSVVKVMFILKSC